MSVVLQRAGKKSEVRTTRGVFTTQSNIYDGEFFAKLVNG